MQACPVRENLLSRRLGFRPRIGDSSRFGSRITFRFEPSSGLKLRASSNSTNVWNQPSSPSRPRPGVSCCGYWSRMRKAVLERQASEAECNGVRLPVLPTALLRRIPERYDHGQGSTKAQAVRVRLDAWSPDAVAVSRG
jgi:hypothetical protein